MRRFCFLAAMSFTAAAFADMRITEWAYSASNGEFIEFTNVGASPISLVGWSYDDDSRLAGVVDLSAFGTVEPGESVILTEAVEADFRLAWGLPSLVKVIGGNTTNLGRNDEINLFDAGSTLVDRLTFGDQTFVGSIRTQNFSGNPGTPGVLGTNNVFGWVLSASGDSFGSVFSSFGDVGNPGVYVPEPSSLALLSISGLALARRRR